MSKRPLKKGTLVRVRAQDWNNYGEEDWNGEPEALISAAMRFWGEVVEDYGFEDRDLIISAAWSEDEGTSHDVWVIPTGCITSLEAGEFRVLRSWEQIKVVFSEQATELMDEMMVDTYEDEALR